jgi:hypothetical protein
MAGTDSEATGPAIHVASPRSALATTTQIKTPLPFHSSNAQISDISFTTFMVSSNPSIGHGCFGSGLTSLIANKPPAQRTARASRIDRTGCPVAAGYADATAVALWGCLIL